MATAAPWLMPEQVEAVEAGGVDHAFEVIDERFEIERGVPVAEAVAAFVIAP